MPWGEWREPNPAGYLALVSTKVRPEDQPTEDPRERQPDYRRGAGNHQGRSGAQPAVEGAERAASAIEGAEDATQAGARVDTPAQRPRGTGRRRAAKAGR